MKKTRSSTGTIPFLALCIVAAASIAVNTAGSGAPEPAALTAPEAALAPAPAAPDAPAPYSAEAPAPAPEAAPEPPYTEQDVEMLARMVFGEARGLPPEEQALCAWTAINRLESGRFGATLEDVLAAPRQFVGYSPNHPVTDGVRAVAEGALAAWAAGEPAPALPPYAETGSYLYFSGARGGDGRMHNFFGEEWR
ncbi:MAG: hypothetical protein LBS32_07695 [Clostridiales Family XIII bacterium]|nr:hypothetical protein [Clostridiales Family XIII bacterium]